MNETLQTLALTTTKITGFIRSTPIITTTDADKSDFGASITTWPDAILGRDGLHGSTDEHCQFAQYQSHQ